MSIARCLRALAFCCISALVANAASGEVPAAHARSAELEASLAAKRDVYLVVGVESGGLAIRVRGVTLESVALDSVTAFEQRRFAGSAEGAVLEVPRVFVTAATISLVDRRVVAPESLEPWSEDSGTGRSLAKDDARPETPSSYDVPLDDGWILEVRQEAADLSRTGRFVSALADGWSHLTSSCVRDRRPAVRLVMDENAARRIHHLFKKGTPVLLVPDLSFRPVR